VSRRVSGLGLLLLIFASSAAAQQLRIETFRNREVVSQEIIVKFRGATAAQRRADRVRDSDIAATTPVGNTGALRLRSSGRNVAALLQAYANRPDVEYAEPNFIWRARDIPNDLFFQDQWALRNTGQVVEGAAGIAGADIKAVQAWDITEGSRGIVVGIVDSGIDYLNADLAPNIWSAPTAFSVTISGQTIHCPAGSHGFNAINKTCDPMDDRGHGTNMAGIIGATGNNGRAISGVSRLTSMMGLKFLNSTGVGTTADAIAAIEFAVQVKNNFPLTANVRVLNASWGGESFSQALLDEINLADARGMLFVTASGNELLNLDVSPQYPASYSATNIVVVGSTDQFDGMSGFSNYGKASVDLLAPGVGILTTGRDNRLETREGTSAATAVVSGAAALILSACSLNTPQLKSNLMSSVDVIPATVPFIVTGGRLNVNTAVQNCVGNPPRFTLEIAPTSRMLVFGNVTAEYTLSLTPLNGFSSTVDLAVLSPPAGFSIVFSPPSLSTGSTTLSVTVDSTVPDGIYDLNITATGGGVTRIVGVSVTVGVPLSCAIVAGGSGYSGFLEKTDHASIHRPSSFADYCSVTVAGERAVSMTMNSSFGSYLYLLSSTGDVIASDEDTGAGDDARILTVLTAGTYFVELTSRDPAKSGSYSFGVSLTLPILTSLTPSVGVHGTSVNITVTGENFIGSPFGIQVSNCPGTTVSNVIVASPTTATATLNLPTLLVFCGIRVSTPAGSSSVQLNFKLIPPPPTITDISPSFGVHGQTVPVTITGTNLFSASSDDKVFFSAPNVSFAVKTRTSTTITLDLNINVNTVPGLYDFTVTTSGGTSNTATFTIVAAPPIINFLSPAVGGPGLSGRVVISGKSFTAPFQINTGSDIQVSDANLTNLAQIEATFTVSPTAAFGNYPVSVTTTAGTSPAVMFAIAPQPTLTSLSPHRAFLGRNTTVTLTGTNFYCETNPLIDGSDVSVSSNSQSGGCSSTSKPITVAVSPTAPVGPRNIKVSGPNGVSNSVTIDIVPVPPIIQSVTPPYGRQGASNVISIVASDLNLGPISVGVSGAGIQVTSQTVAGSTLTATVAITSDAPIGSRNLTVTNNQGESDPVVFTVTPPTWPDLTVRQVLPPQLFRGFNETQIITVRNEGTKETTIPVTVTTTLPFDGISVSTSSPGWSCSSSGRTTTCTSPLSIAVNAERTLELTLTIPSLSGSGLIAVEVTSAEDYNPSNNRVTVTVNTASPPLPRFVISPLPLQPGQQATLGIEMPVPFHHDVVGTMNTVTLSFNVFGGGTVDPAVQFATGGRSIGYIIRANTGQGEIGGVPGPIGFQTGTLQGSITFTGTFKAGNNSPIPFSTSATLQGAQPTITATAAEKTSNGVVFGITMFAPSRVVTNLSFQFDTTTPVLFGCGGVAGCSASGSRIQFNVQSLFSTWYSNNSGFGSLAIVRVPFTLQGTIAGTVTVTSTNPSGTSNVMSFPLP